MLAGRSDGYELVQMGDDGDASGASRTPGTASASRCSYARLLLDTFGWRFVVLLTVQCESQARSFLF